ncbi:MAG: AAA family ATPase [Latescibacteria bacterium DG_63]|nr:MAG: AAA family ATPase [Latescibacteria bacterium DG_63]
MEKNELQYIEQLREARQKVSSELRKVIVNQEHVIEELLVALFASGHCLIVGVPGLAKTLLVSSLARVLELRFTRIQFTPDLMPSDITGTEILHEDPASKIRHFKFVKGPVFANIVLADEINRTPPKTQAALLQAMQEYEVTAAGETYKLDLPFFVLATQNPIELEGTYPLPEAQLDRFMFNIYIDYPAEADERLIVRTTTGSALPSLSPVLGASDVLRLQRIVRTVPVSDYVVDYAVRLARASRPGRDGAPDFVKSWVSWGAGPRASQYLVLGAKARAVLRGELTPSCEDVRAVATCVLRHRILTNFSAEAEGITTPDIIGRLLETVPEDGRKT